jgi:hypothetical protein
VCQAHVFVQECRQVAEIKLWVHSGELHGQELNKSSVNKQQKKKKRLESRAMTVLLCNQM